MPTATPTATPIPLPGRPDVPSLRSTDSTSMQVAWEPPETQAPINGYDYRYREDSRPWVEVVDTGLTGTGVGITGLTPATTYYVQVRAATAGGSGEWSPTASASTLGLPTATPTATAIPTATPTPTATPRPTPTPTRTPRPTPTPVPIPGLPAALTVDGLTYDSIVVEWQRPVRGGVTGYEYRYGPAGGYWAEPYGRTTDTTVYIDGLDPDTTYNVEVRSLRGSTRGLWTESSWATTWFISDVITYSPDDLASVLNVQWEESQTPDDVDIYVGDYGGRWKYYTIGRQPPMTWLAMFGGSNVAVHAREIAAVLEALGFPGEQAGGWGSSVMERALITPEGSWYVCELPSGLQVGTGRRDGGDDWYSVFFSLMDIDYKANPPDCPLG